jgi:hypothetical protein
MGGAGEDTETTSDWAWRDVLAGHVDEDLLARAVSRSRVAEHLFATKQQVKLGRYHLLERVGAGGMGVVWGAWDPELDRRVAIKLVNATVRVSRDRIVAEGHALAKLSHPNVVPVYDVGVVGDQIYIVMEWVRGENLREYLKQPRSVREIVAIYRAAGEGLSAAHRAGLVHRDFKPDNAVLGQDGRVRVLDFGLARGEVRAAASPGPAADPVGANPKLTRGVGTPRYMAPEQTEGKELTGAVDQYAFGVSLREALAGRAGPDKPVAIPRWLDEILARSTAPAAADRYPSMDALLHVLARDPQTVRWRRLVLAAGALGVAGATFAVGQLRACDDMAVDCIGGTQEIAKAWNDGGRARMAAHLRGLGDHGALEAARLDDELRRYSTTWARAYRDACMALDRGELTPLLYERSLGCLTRARVALETVVSVLSSVEDSGLPDAVIAARGLPLAERCVIEAQTSTIEPPRPEIAAEAAEVANDIERARVLVTARAATSRMVASAAAAGAKSLGYLPLIARAQLVLERASLSGDGKDAAAGSSRARAAAFEVGD